MNEQQIITGLKKVFDRPTYWIIATSLSLNIFFIYYLIFLQTTTLTVFFASNNAFYNWASIILTILNSIFFGVAITTTIYLWENKTSSPSTQAKSFLGVIFGALSSGCPVCGAYLLPLLGIAGSLAAFPFQGLEIKLISILLLAFAIKENLSFILNLCSIPTKKLVSWQKDHLVVNIDRHTVSQAKPAFVFVLSILILYALPKLPPQFKFSFASKQSISSPSNSPSNTTTNINTTALLAQVNPDQGYTVNASFGDLGPKLVNTGAIDLEKFKQIYERSGQPLTPQQLKILTQGSNEKITINKNNAYFLINFLWALGLANKNQILDQGQMTKYGDGQIGSFASTGGWTIGTKPATEIYSRSRLITLTPAQQAVVEEAANNTYRPCCGNPTSFPDCNHGMAMLGLFELMASQGATVDQLYNAAKYFNAFWFPQQYLDIATYFQAKEGKDFAQVPAKTVVSKELSSSRGWTQVRKWLSNNQLIQKTPSGGGGCGV